MQPNSFQINPLNMQFSPLTIEHLPLAIEVHPMAHSVITFDHNAVLSQASFQQIAKNITVPNGAAELRKFKWYHGTSVSEMRSVMKGAKNMGKGFAGEALYFFLDEPANAIEYAHIKTQFRGTPGILEGTLNPKKPYVVGRIQITRNIHGTDLLKGIWPADWSKNPTLKNFVQSHFDILEVCGAESAGLAMPSNRFAVVYQKSGPDTIRWHKAYALKNKPIPSKLFSKTLDSQRLLPHLGNPGQQAIPRNIHIGLRGLKYGLKLFEIAGLLLNINGGIAEEARRLPFTSPFDRHEARGAIRGTVRYFSNMMLHIIDPGASFIDPVMALEAAPLSSQQRSELQEQRRQDLNNSRPTTLYMDEMLEHGVVPKDLPEQSSSARALAVDRARKWRAREEKLINTLIQKFDLIRDPHEALAEFRKYSSYMGNIQVPKDFFTWSPQQQSQWFQDLVSKAESFFTPTVNRQNQSHSQVSSSLTPEVTAPEPCFMEAPEVMADLPSGMEGLLKQESVIKNLIAEIHQDIDTTKRENVKSRNAKSKINWPQMVTAIGINLIHEAADYLSRRKQLKEIRYEVKAFINRYEKEKERIGQPIPTDNLEQIRGDLFDFFKRIQNPALVEWSFCRLEEAHKDLCESIEQLQLAKKDYEQEKLILDKEDPKLLAKEKKYKKSLDKALRSGKRANKKTGIFKSILSTVGVVLSCIPGPTQLIGAAVIAGTQATGSLVSQNTNGILNGRLNNNQTKLSGILDQRRAIAERQRQIDHAIDEIANTQRSIDQWILSDESSEHLTVEGKLNLLQNIANESFNNLTSINNEIKDKKNSLAALEKEWQDAENVLNQFGGTAETREHFWYQQKKIKEYRQKLAAQAARAPVIEKVRNEINDLEKDKTKAEADYTTKNSILIEETNLKPLHLFGEEIQKSYDPTIGMNEAQRAEYLAKKKEQNEFSANLQKFDELQLREIAPYLNFLNATGALLQQLSIATGSYVPMHMYNLGHSAVQLNMMQKRFNKALEQRALLQDVSFENQMHHFVIPALLMLTHASAIWNAAYALAATTDNYLSKPEIPQTELSWYHKEMVNYMQWLPGWINSQLTQLSREISAGQERQNEMMGELQASVTTFRKELDLTLEEFKDEILGEMKKGQLDEHVKTVQLKVQEFETLGILFSQRQNKTEDRWRKFLCLIEKGLEDNLKEPWSGYRETYSSRGATLQPTVETEKVHQNPHYLTGLIGRLLKPNQLYPNWSMLQTLSEQFAVATSGQLPSDSDNLAKVKKIAATLAKQKDLLTSLFAEIGPLIIELNQKQRKLVGQIQKNRLFWETKREQEHKSRLQKAVQPFLNFSEKDLLRNKRYFVYHEVAMRTFFDIIKRFDFEKIHNEVVGPFSFKGEVITAGICALAYFTPAAPFAIPLAIYVRLCNRIELGYFKNCSIQGLGEITGRSFSDIFQFSLASSINSDNSVTLVADIREKGWRQPESTIPRTFGINLKERKIVEMKNNETSSFIKPLFQIDVLFIADNTMVSAKQLKIKLDDHSLIKLEELPKIHRTMTSYSYPEDIFIQLSTYSEFLQSINGKKVESDKHEKLLKNLGKYEILISNKGTIPLAFPQALLKACEEQISSELSSAEKCNLGTFLPSYEFSADEGTLSIVYNFHLNGRNPQVYCKFTVAAFDPVTLLSFQKELVDDHGLPIRKLLDPNEFLVQMMYTGFNIPHAGENSPTATFMPGDETVSLESGLIAPSDLPFPGLYRILSNDPTVMLQFNCFTYTKERMCELFVWLDQKENNKCSQETLKKIVPTELIVPSSGAQYSKDAISIWLDIHKATRKFCNPPLDQYAVKYSLLMSLINLFSSCETPKVLDNIANDFGIYPPSQRTICLNSFLDPLDPEKELNEEDIKDFLTLLEEHPSPDFMTLMADDDN